MVDVISSSFWNECFGSAEHDGEPLHIRNAEAFSSMECRLVCNVQFGIGRQDYNHDVVVGPVADDFSIGLDFLIQRRAIMDIASIDPCTDDTVSGNQTLQPVASRIVGLPF